MQLGYCTNVHPGMTLEEIEAQLDEHAVDVRQHLDMEVLPIGLWLPASVVHAVDVEELDRRLSNRGLQVFTMRDIDMLGIHEVMGQALAIATKGTSGFHLSFDLDGTDPSVAPGVGTPVPGGTTLKFSKAILKLSRFFKTISQESPA